MNQISLFEAKVANGNGEQTLSREVYRLGHQFDFFRMLSFYFTTVGFYFSSMVREISHMPPSPTKPGDIKDFFGNFFQVTVLTVYMFLYGRVYMALSGLERRILEDSSIH